MTNSTLRRVLAVLAALVVVASPMAGVAGASDAGGHSSAVGESLGAASTSQLNTAAMAPGDAVYRVNAGGNTITSSSGPDWTGNWEQYHSGSSSTFSTSDSITLDASVPSGTPTDVFQSEVYGDQQWTFSDSVQSGTEYEVRLYFAEIFAESDGERAFDVSVEGSQVLDDYDIHADVGHDVGVMKSYSVTPTDGDIDVTLTTEVDNAKISAIEVVESEPEPDTLGGPSSVDFGSVVVGDSATETVTVTNLGGDGDPDITIDDVSVSGDSAFSAGAASQTTLAPGESADIPVTFAPADAQSMSATLEVTHSGSNSPLSVALSGEGTSTAEVGFSKSSLEGFSAGNPTAIDFGPDGRAYVSTQGGTVYALEVERTGEDSYQVVNEEQIDAIKDIPNHDDLGNLEAGQDNRQITGLTVGGTADAPEVYVSSSDPEISVGQDDDSTDTNSGAISRLTFDWNDDGSLANVDHEVLVLGLPRSEENHATNGLDLTADEETLYVAQGGHTNKGAPGDNFGHTPEYALSAAALEIDLAQIEANHQSTSLQSHDSDYPDLDYLYSIPTVQGGDLPFGGDNGLNQAKMVPDGPVQVYSPGYRNPYDLVLSEDDQLYVIDNGPNGGWGGQPADSSGNIVDSQCTNHPNEDGSYGTGDQLHLATEGSYGGHATPIRANPDDAGLYDADGNQYHDFDSSDTPVPFDMANPIECDYQDPDEDNSIGPTFGWTGGITEYTASNFGGGMQGDLLVVEAGSGTIKRVQLNAAGDAVTDVSSSMSQGGALGIAAQDDDGSFPGTVWTANHGGNDVTVFEPNDYGDTGDGEECTGADDPSLDEDGDGYDNADEIDAGSDPCSAASTPPDFDDDGTSNVNDPDDDNDGIDDTEDLFAIDPDNGLANDLPATYGFAPNSHSGTILDLGFTGVMMNGQNYQDLYDPGEVTAGGAANVLTVENVGQGDAHANTNTQEHAYQVGVNASEPFTVETTVNGLPSDAESFQSQGVFVGTGDQDNYAKLTVTGFSSGSGSGVQFATEDGGSFNDVANPPAPTAGNTTTLSMTVYPGNGTVETYYTMQGGSQQFVDETTVPTSWFDTADGNGTAVGVIATSNGADSTFDATWQYLDVEPLEAPTEPVSADAGADQTVDEGDSVTLDATGSTGESLSYSWTQTAGQDVTLSDASSATPTFTAPEVDADETLTFEVEVSDGESTDTDEVNVTVQDVDEPAEPTGVLYRVNAGGSELAAVDDGPAWGADTSGTPSQYLVDPSGSDTYNDGVEVTPTDDVPDSTPDAVFDAERFDEPDDGVPMDWEFPVESGTEVEVRLYFGNQFPGTSEPGQREFNVSVEGDQVLTNYDPVADVGHANGTMKSFAVTSDGTLDVDFEHGAIENPMVNAIEVVAVGDGTGDDLSIAEAVAMGGENDTLIEDSEIQSAINWWATDSEVPDTGGQTISDSEIQSLINLWATEAQVGDGNEPPTASFTASPDAPEAGQQVTFDASASTDSDGSIASYEWDYDGDGATDATGEQVTNTFDAAGDYDVTLTVTDDDGATDTATETVTVTESTADPGAASVSVTPDSGTEASTYSGGSFTVENTGEKQISSVTFDLSSSAMPDMVFDPDGTAGDQAAKGLNIDSESGDGVGVVSTADDDVFSQPHNGVNGSDGYDVLTIEFTDFDPGESVSFSADNDPTSIKDASISSQEAGPVSGLELARSTVSAEYADGSVQETQLFGDGSAGGAQATLDESVPPAPSIGVQNVDLDDGALRDHHSAATVSEADQTVTVTGEAGETVTLLHFEAELELDNVPEYDGTPGYDIEAYEANKIEQVNYETVTLDSSGEAEVPVTLLDTTDVGGYNYFVATHGEPGSDTGLDSNVVVLEYDASAGDEPVDGDTAFAVNAGGDAYTAADGTEFQADTNFDGGSTFTTGDAGTPSDPEISNTDDDELYHTERYGDFGYDVPLDDGEYEVTLHFAELYQGVANDGGEGDRLFDVSIEGEQVLDSYDIYAEAGGAHAAVTETFTAEVTDGELNVDFSTVEDNAKVSAIEVEPVDDSSGGGDTGGTASADFAVNENGGIDASTYGSGSFEIANTGDQQITSVTYDLSSAAFPDVVFDPEGTAGDSGAKGFTPDSGESAVDPSGSFAAPHNGENGEDGYDELVVDFGDFEAGETFAFSTDIDPTSIKNADGTGAAGAISGLELSGATVTVEYADGTTQTTSLYGDGSSGGSQAAAKDGVPDAPTVGAQDVSLDSSALDAHHSAATVSEASQTITVSGPADATVEVLHVEGQLELANQADGYDLEEYEANTAENVDYHEVQLDSNGEATVDVTLTNTSSSGVEGGFNYFLAAVQDGTGDTGETSNAVVLKYDESADDGGSSTAQVLHRVNAGEDTTVTATDDGPDWTGVADTSSQYLASVASTDAGNSCVGTITSTTANVPSSTPDGVWNCERYGEMTWEFDVDSGQQVEVRLYVGNSYSGASEPGDRQFNVSIEGQQVLTQYDPVADVGHETGTMKNFTVTDDGDGTITVVFEEGAVENPEVRAIEILESADGSS